MTDENNPILTWAVELHGLPADLMNWEKLFHDRRAATVQRELMDNGAPAFFIYSLQMDGVRDVEVHKVVAGLLEWMNGAAKAYGGAQPVTAKWIWYIRADGMRRPLKQVTATAGLHIEILTTVDTKPPASTPAPVDAQKGIILANTDDHVASALAYFGEPDNWFDFWKTFETIEGDIWRRTTSKERGNLKAIRKKSASMKLGKAKGDTLAREALRSRKWVSEHDLIALTENINYHRHYTVGKAKPNPLLKRDQVREILATIVRQWLQEKARLPGLP